MGSVVPDPVWVLGEWEMSANRFSKLPQESLLQARHSCGPWDERAQELAQKKTPGKGKGCQDAEWFTPTGRL